MSTDMGDPIAAAEAALQRVEAQVRQAQQRRAGAQALAEEVRTITATAKSKSGQVSVTAQPSGRVLAVEFEEPARSLTAAELSRVVCDTIASAQHRAAMAAVEQSARRLGEESEFVTHLRHEAEQAFPAPGSPTQGGLTWSD